jgi:hypothetical protein
MNESARSLHNTSHKKSSLLYDESDRREAPHTPGMSCFLHFCGIVCDTLTFTVSQVAPWYIQTRARDEELVCSLFLRARRQVSLLRAGAREEKRPLSVCVFLSLTVCCAWTPAHTHAAIHSSPCCKWVRDDGSRQEVVGGIYPHTRWTSHFAPASIRNHHNNCTSGM